MTMKQSIFMALSLNMALFSCDTKKPETAASTVPPPPPPVVVVEVKVDTLCFEYIFNKMDINTVQLVMKGDNVTGEMHWHPYEKDGAHGTLKGVKKGDVITADYAYMMEGSNQMEEVVFKLESNKLSKLEGELVEKGEKMVLKDPTKAKSSEVYKKVDCSRMLKDTQ